MVEPTIFAIVGIIILVGLGVWQLDRRQWKEVLIATTTERLSRAPENLPPRDSWARLLPDGRRIPPRDVSSRISSRAGSAGLHARLGVSPGRFRRRLLGVRAGALAGGSIVIVNRGFVPLDRKDPATRTEGTPHGIVDVVGVMRWPETRGLFTPADEPQNNVWFIARSEADRVGEKMGDASRHSTWSRRRRRRAAVCRSAGKLVVALPDNHLQYALTWFGLALGLAGVYLVWITGRIRGRN